jgi:hypothetical protein
LDIWCQLEMFALKMTHAAAPHHRAGEEVGHRIGLAFDPVEPVVVVHLAGREVREVNRVLVLLHVVLLRHLGGGAPRRGELDAGAVRDHRRPREGGTARDGRQRGGEGGAAALEWRDDQRVRRVGLHRLGRRRAPRPLHRRPGLVLDLVVVVLLPLDLLEAVPPDPHGIVLWLDAHRLPQALGALCLELGELLLRREVLGVEERDLARRRGPVHDRGLDRRPSLGEGRVEQRKLRLVPVARDLLGPFLEVRE